MDAKMKSQQPQNKRLLLSRETVRTLTSPDLLRVDGGILKLSGSCIGCYPTADCPTTGFACH